MVEEEGGSSGGGGCIALGVLHEKDVYYTAVERYTEELLIGHDRKKGGVSKGGRYSTPERPRERGLERKMGQGRGGVMFWKMLRAGVGRGREAVRCSTEALGLAIGNG